MLLLYRNIINQGFIRSEALTNFKPDCCLTRMNRNIEQRITCLK
jgi:hypothetical protein